MTSVLLVSVPDGASTPMQGSGPVDKKIKNADKVDMLPWRPKVARAPPLILKCSIGAFAMLAAWQFVSVANEGVVNGAMCAVVLQARPSLVGSCLRKSPRAGATIVPVHLGLVSFCPLSMFVTCYLALPCGGATSPTSHACRRGSSTSSSLPLATTRSASTLASSTSSGAPQLPPRAPLAPCALCCGRPCARGHALAIAIVPLRMYCSRGAPGRCPLQARCCSPALAQLGLSLYATICSVLMLASPFELSCRDVVSVSAPLLHPYQYWHKRNCAPN